MRKKWNLWLYAVLLFLAYSFGVGYFGYEKGYAKAKEKAKTSFILDSTIIENHAKEIEKIIAESDSAATDRFHRNFGSK